MRVSYNHLGMYNINLSRTFRLFNLKIPNNTSIQCSFYGKYPNYLGRKFEIWMKGGKLNIFHFYKKEIEYFFQQNIRRSVQICNFYTKIRGDLAVQKIMNSWKHHLGRKEILFSAVGVTMFNWNRERITDDEVYSYYDEMDKIRKLRDDTVVCPDCQLRLVIDKQQPDVEYCTCGGSKPRYAPENSDSEWQPFIERQDMLIWRRAEPDTGGLYTYKVFGTFSDVSAQDFLKVQVDVEYRKSWDSTAKKLEIIDSDEASTLGSDHRTDVIYWELDWPMFFSNRDYVYQRRWLVDEDKGVVVIVSRTTDHPNAPNRTDAYRVTSYWSYMVIKPSSSFKEPGIEFSLTYFDDPGINIPSAVVVWVAMRGLPDFLCRMRDAARNYKNYICSENSINEQLIATSTDDTSGTKDKSIENSEDCKLSESSDAETKIGIEISEISSANKVDCVEKGEIICENEIVDQTEEKNGFLRYFFLTKLFA